MPRCAREAWFPIQGELYLLEHKTAQANESKPGESWVVPQPSATDSLPLRQAHNVFLDNVEVELDVLIANGLDEEKAGSQDTTVPEPAMRQLPRVLGCQNCLLFVCSWYGTFH